MIHSFISIFFSFFLQAKAKPNSHIEAPHGQVYLPHFYYGRDYPIPVEPYLAHAGLPPKNDPHQRGHGPPISPRLLDYYRRSEHGMADRSRNEYEAERRAEERREKERACVMRTSSVDSIKNQKQKHEECPTPEKDIHRISPGRGSNLSFFLLFFPLYLSGLVY